MDRGRDIVLAAIEQIECLAARQGDPQTRPITDTSDLRKILPAGGEKDLREKIGHQQAVRKQAIHPDPRAQVILRPFLKERLLETLPKREFQPLITSTCLRPDNITVAPAPLSTVLDLLKFIKSLQLKKTERPIGETGIGSDPLGLIRRERLAVFQTACQREATVQAITHHDPVPSLPIVGSRPTPYGHQRKEETKKGQEKRVLVRDQSVHASCCSIIAKLRRIIQDYIAQRYLSNPSPTP